MNLQLSELNYLAVLVAAVVGFAPGALWFASPVFGKAWMEEMKLTEEDRKARSGGGAEAIYLRAFLMNVVSAVMLAIVLRATGVVGTAAGVQAGLLVALGFVAPTMGINYLFERRTRRLFLIYAGYYALTFALMGAVIGAWR